MKQDLQIIVCASIKLSIKVQISYMFKIDQTRWGLLNDYDYDYDYDYDTNKKNNSTSQYCDKWMLYNIYIIFKFVTWEITTTWRSFSK